MLAILQIITLMLVSLAMATAVAHALELPGKMRLSQETYLAMQGVYYPGFTFVGGIGEIVGMLAVFGLVFATPRESIAFELTLAAFIAMALMQIVFWVFTQPANKFWIRGQSMTGAGAAFFRLGRADRDSRSSDWTALRNQWEYSHVARAVMSFTALTLLASAIAAT